MSLPASSPYRGPGARGGARNAGDRSAPTRSSAAGALPRIQNPNDRARTEAAARGQCKQPYVISAGTSGGVIMHLADQATPQELRLKGSPSGKNYIGPPGPAGGEQDREIVSFDGRVLITRFIDKDAATRYGNMVYVRCAPARLSRPSSRGTASAMKNAGVGRRSACAGRPSASVQI